MTFAVAVQPMKSPFDLQIKGIVAVQECTALTAQDDLRKSQTS